MKTGLIVNWRTLCAAACLSLAALGAATPGRAESSFVEGLGSFVAADSAVDSAGFTYLVGQKEDSQGNKQGYLVKIDQAGGRVEKLLNGLKPAGGTEKFLPVSISIGFDIPGSVATLVGPTDAIYIASATKIILVDPGGSTVESLAIPSRTLTDVAYAPLASGGVVSGAVFISGTKGTDAFVARVNADLTPVATTIVSHEKVYGNNAGGDTATAVAVDELGDVYVSGRLARGRNELGELGLNNTWSVKLYQKSGVSISSFANFASVAVSANLVQSATATTINYNNNFPGGRRDDFYMVAETNIYVPADASYTFNMTSDDGQRLYLDGELIKSDDALHGATPVASGAISVPAGFHKVRYEMFERGGDEVAKLEFNTNGTTTYSALPSFTFGGDTGYVFKFDPALSSLKAHHLASYEDGVGGAYTDLKYSRGWVYATGFWSGTSDARDDLADGQDIETVKLDSALRLKGRATVTGVSSLKGHSVVPDEVGNVYFTGSYGPASVDFIGDGGTKFTSKSSSVESRFVAKLSSNMEYVWVETEKNQAPDFNDGAIDTTIMWNEELQKVFLTAAFTGNAALTYGNPGQLETIFGGQGFLLVMEPGGTFTQRVDLTVISVYGVGGTQVQPFGGTPDLPATQRRIKGAQIIVSVPKAIYQNVSGVELNDPSRETVQSVAERRLRPTGYTLSDGTITDDGQFVYSGKLEDDLTVTFNWVTEFALTIDLDLAGTRGTVVGSINSTASGRPSPEVRKHWIQEDEQASPEIDGYIQDIESAGGAIRYVVAGYYASGPPNTNVAPTNFEAENFFPIPTVETRHKVAPFTMEGPAKITWVLIKQNGIQVTTTGPASLGLPLIQVVSNPAQRLALGLPPQTSPTGSGTFFFDEHTSVQIVTVAAEGTQQVRGWLGGDGIVFPSSGQLSALTSFTINTKTYRGLAVQDLIRPARVMWDYGDRIYEESVRIGGSTTFSGLDPAALGRIRADLPPDRIDIIDGPTGSSINDLVLWDPEGRKLYPLRPGEVLTYWRTNDADPNMRLIIRQFLSFPTEPHYRHVAGTPGVSLDPSEDDLLVFREIKYTENQASTGGDKKFVAQNPGLTVLMFGELSEIARGQQRETFRVRVVETKLWSDGLPPVRNVPIGAKVKSAYDTAKLDTGYVYFPLARFNPFVHNRSEVTGPIIPVNREFQSSQDYDLMVVWYERRDQLVWPYQAEMLNPVWLTAAQGLGRIVIASEFGSESVSEAGLDQEVVGEVTVDVLDEEGNPTGAQETVPPATTYDPSRFQQLQVYTQPVPAEPGYNPNEEHGLIAPSRRFSSASPLPGAAFGLRDNDLNIRTPGPAYTSDPYVLTQFLDVVDGEFKMKVYSVVRESSRSNLGSRNYDYRFAIPKAIEAGKPVIPFYPLGQVIGATPCAETFGLDDNPAQLTYWEDHKGGSWSVSGGEDASFKVYYYCPLQPDFWWPANGVAGTNPAIGGKNVGDCLPFLPIFTRTGETSFATHKPTAIKRNSNGVPQAVTFQSEWPVNTPVLKVGETLTFAGGEYKADNPTVPVPDGAGGVVEKETPGLPGVLAWAAGEVIYDHLNPDMDDQGAFDTHTARIFQALEDRSITVDRDSLPETFQPANTQVIRVRDGKWFFAALPASLQKRVFYDPVTEKLTIRGLLNDKTIGDATLTAAPPPLYVLEPNLMTPTEVSELAGLAPENFQWQDAVTALHKYTRNPALLDKGKNGVANAGGQDDYLPGLGAADDAYRVGLERKIKRTPAGDPVVLTDGVVSTTAGGSRIDSDGDLMDDGWETRFFGNLGRDGNADFTGDSPAAWSSMLRQLGPPYVGPVALNPSKNVIENVGLIELYETILQRALDLTVRNGIPVTPGLGNAIELASTRLLDFHTLLGNEAYADALDPTIGVDGGSVTPAVFAFQNQVADLSEEELALLRGQDKDRGRPFYNRLFPNFTKGEGEPAYAINYNLQDANTDGFIDESDALLLYPHGHGDSWGHYLTAIKTQYDLLREPLFNWESRSELYNLLDVVIEVDFRDERKFAAAAKARTGAEVVDLTYRSRYVENPEGQWQGYTETDAARGWGVEEWARRASQGAYLDWITANALLPSVHPNETLEGIEKIDRTTNKDIAVISAGLTRIQQVFDNANGGVNPAGVSGDTIPFDINPNLYYAGYIIDDEGREGHTHFEQVYQRALVAMKNASALFTAADAEKARLREVSNEEDSYQRSVFEEDLSFRNRLIEIFGTPYEGTIGSGKLYPAGYSGPDLITWMYADVREISAQTVPGPTVTFGGDLVYDLALGRYSYNGGSKDTDYSFIHPGHRRKLPRRQRDRQRGDPWIQDCRGRERNRRRGLR